MQFSFDLISDLHLDHDGTVQEFNWHGQATSRFCIVAGDIARNRNLVIRTLEHLGSCYQAVFYIDGNDEHKNYMDDLGRSYYDLRERINRLRNVHFLQDHVIVTDGIALLATNGWWAYNFDPDADPDNIRQIWLDDSPDLIGVETSMIEAFHHNDAAYIKRSIKRLQLHNDVKKIVVVTHTVPNINLVNYDLKLTNSWRYGVIGNRSMEAVLELDTEKKIHTWCFGHYHGPVDRIIDGVRFVNNCRGRAGSANTVYFPKKIVVDL